MNQYKGKIVYIGPMSFPKGGAGARRILGNALTFMTAGYEVFVGSGQLPETPSIYNEDFKGIHVFSIGERTAENKPVLIKHLLYSNMGKKTVKWLKTLDFKPDAIILYGGDIPYLLNLLPWCRKQSIPIVYEACEWYDPSNTPGGKYSLYRLSFEITMKYFVPRLKNVIAISSFLDNHFRSLGCETICIPPTLDKLEFLIKEKKHYDGLVTICYAGTPGNKDLFNNYLEALLSIDPSGVRFRLNVAGLTVSEILSYPAIKRHGFKELPSIINCIGKVDHNDAIDLIGNSDFSILLRYPKRYAHAGFPTKVVESMIMGTPVICNLTSDLHKYIHHGISGIVCKDHTVNSLIESLLLVEGMLSEDITHMSKMARRIAEDSFDYRNYVTAIENFMKNISLF
jgi:glycosyltransferase involved in cell wall biosynthesis